MDEGSLTKDCVETERVWAIGVCNVKARAVDLVGMNVGDRRGVSEEIARLTLLRASETTREHGFRDSCMLVPRIW